MRKWLLSSVLASLVLMGCVLTSWLPQSRIEPTADAFQLTATKLIAEATFHAGGFDPQLLTDNPQLVTPLVAEWQTLSAIEATSEHATKIVRNQTETAQAVLSETATALGTLPPYLLTATPIYQTQLAAAQLITENPPAVTATLAARQTVLVEQQNRYLMYETQNAATREAYVPATAQTSGTPRPFYVTVTAMVQNLTSTVELEILATESPQAVTETLRAINIVATENALMTQQAPSVTPTATYDAVSNCVAGQVTVWYTSEWDRLDEAFIQRGYNAVVDVYGSEYTDDCVVSDVMSKTYFFMIAGQHVDVIVTDVIEILQDYPVPPSIYNTSPHVSINITLLDDTNTVVGHRSISFSYDEAIAAYEDGLRGADLLNALRIPVPQEE